MFESPARKAYAALESTFDYAVVELPTYVPERYIEVEELTIKAHWTRQRIAVLWERAQLKLRGFSALAAMHTGDGVLRSLFGFCESKNIVTAYTDIEEHEECREWERAQWQALVDIAAPGLTLKLETVPTRKVPFRPGERISPLRRVDYNLLPTDHALRLIPERYDLGYWS